MNDFLIRQVTTEDKETLEQIFKLRVTCRQEQGYITVDKFPNGYFDNSDFTAFHFGVFFKDKIVAASRLNIFDGLKVHPYYPAFTHLDNLPTSAPISYLSRVVVLPEFRKNGLSKALVNEREKFSANKNVTNLFADVSDFQIDNFKSYGYQTIGMLDTKKIKWDINPDHFLMYKQL